MENDDGDVEQDEFRIEVDLGTVLNWYLDGEELKKLIRKDKNVSNNDLSLKDLMDECLRWYSIRKKNTNFFWNVLKCIL
jgi:hypothetical protein